ncbi:hypothetical protein ACIQYS_21845 [Psychrobacillus sp. NPDC096426]|uniref:hypothetical protein n=1 Tax=Psychrobacillus sp. NPDC096426 TaxID=3364491 RepID=UPI0037FBE5FB
MKNRAKIWVIFIFSIILLTACQQGTEEPEIRISSASEQLTPISYGDLQNEEKEEIEERIRSYMVGKKFSELPSISNSEIIQIESLNFEADEFEVYDYILNEKGYIISEYDIAPVILSVGENGIVELPSQQTHNFGTYVDYAVDGKLIHCLLIRTKINNSNFAFATLVLSDSN